MAAPAGIPAGAVRGRSDAFSQLMVGTRFQKKRFASDIAKFQPQVKSPTLHATHRPLQKGMKKLDFFKDDDDDGASTAASTDMGSEIGQGDNSAPAAAAKPPPKPSQKQALELRKQHFIKASGDKVPAPAIEFKQILAWYSVPDSIAKNLFERGFHTPTPIQMQGIPCLLERRDFIGVAPTGSGKTLAFLLPMLARLRKPSKKGLRGLVMAHSKELASQSERELRYLCAGKNWSIQTMTTSKASVNKRDILCTTPGRLESFIKENNLTLGAVEYVVFDEADQLFDTLHDTFFDVMKRTLDLCTLEDKQIAVFSATLPEKCEGIIRQFLKDPLRVMIGTRASASRNVEQRLEYCGKESGKTEAIQQLLQKGLAPPVLVFVQSINRAKDLYTELAAKDVRVAAIHSDRTADQRDRCVREFRLGKINVLIATELMARGVDFKGVATVINFDFPTTIQSYVHRVGRTGRAGHSGVAITLWTDEDRPYLRQVAHIIKGSGNEEVPEWMLNLPKKFGKKRVRKFKRDGSDDGGSGSDDDVKETEEEKEARLKHAAQSKLMPVRREAISAVRRVKDAEDRERHFREVGKKKKLAERKNGGGGDSDDEGPRNKKRKGGGGGKGAPKAKKARKSEE
eukprot:Rhum_TRINITY_DN21271_c0_g1::Rhum_TRINITY_DN21271_c0_g1_i1::g.173606::m.173606/K14779/DDX52, ROK1; ATP-dependent RNA helicase DDX52/ROK1